MTSDNSTRCPALPAILAALLLLPMLSCGGSAFLHHWDGTDWDSEDSTESRSFRPQGAVTPTLFWRPFDGRLMERSVAGGAREVGYVPKEDFVVDYAYSPSGDLLIVLQRMEIFLSGIIYNPFGGYIQPIPKVVRDSRFQLIQNGGRGVREFDTWDEDATSLSFRDSTVSCYLGSPGLCEIDIRTGEIRVLVRDRVQDYAFIGSDDYLYLARGSIFRGSLSLAKPSAKIPAVDNIGFAPDADGRFVLTWNKKGRLTKIDLENELAPTQIGEVETIIRQTIPNPIADSILLLSYSSKQYFTKDPYAKSPEQKKLTGGVEEEISIYSMNWKGDSLTAVAKYTNKIPHGAFRPVYHGMGVSKDGTQLCLWVRDKRHGYVPAALDLTAGDVARLRIH